MSRRQRLNQLRSDLFKVVAQKRKDGELTILQVLVVRFAIRVKPELLEDLLDTIDQEVGPASPLTDFFDWLIENWDKIVPIIEFIIGLFG